MIFVECLDYDFVLFKIEVEDLKLVCFEEFNLDLGVFVVCGDELGKLILFGIVSVEVCVLFWIN